MDRFRAGTLTVIFAASAACTEPKPQAPPGEPAPVAAQTGARLYEGNCVPCHRQDARGVPGVYPSLVGSPVVLGDPAVLARWVVQGRRPATLPAGRYPTTMTRFGWLKPPDGAALLSYVRTHFGNSASTVDAASVAAALDAPP